ncbi:MAG TPA: SDR family oxidoreductase [Polyangiaceae bacterium]
MNYLITGATGNIGSLVVERLLARGERPRVFVRDSGKARSLWGDRVEIAVGDLTDSTTLSTALTEIDAFFLVNSGPELAARDEVAAHTAKGRGVRHLVKLSSIDAVEQNVGTGVWHARGEAAIRASGIMYTFVQPSGFMANALWWAKSIKAEGVVRTATGHGKIPFIHSEDIADVAITALTEREHGPESLPITGPEALSYAGMTQKISAALGKPLECQMITEAEAREQQIAWDAPAPLVEARLSIFRAIREGRLAAVTDTVERVLGRKPLAFDRWVRENIAAFH